MAANSSIEEYDLKVMHAMDHVRALLKSLASVPNASRKGIKQCASLGDDAPADVFTEIVRAADKDIYFCNRTCRAAPQLTASPVEV